MKRDITPILTFPHQGGRDFLAPLTLALSREERGQSAHSSFDKLRTNGGEELLGDEATVYDYLAAGYE